MVFLKDKKSLGQFYTKNSSYIMRDLINVFPAGCEIVDPFCGEWDLLKLVEDDFEVIGFDIDPKNDLTIERDTLFDPPNYTGKWIITNPPYLARNKNSNKSLYNTYGLDDLYKISMETIIGCEGGAIIVPLNFFSGQECSIRKRFLSEYEVGKVYVFEEQVFSDTTYTVCSFSFTKKKNTAQEISFFIVPRNETFVELLTISNDYTIGSEVFNLPEENVGIRRLIKGDMRTDKTIFIMAVDTRKNKILFEVADPFFGKVTDRCFASITFDRYYTEEKLIRIASKANEQLNIYREKYKSLFLTNYRDFGRKRLGFDLAYSILKNAILLLKKEGL